MLKITAKLDLEDLPIPTITSATTDILNSENSSDLSEILNTTDGNAFVSTRTSNKYGDFIRDLEEGSYTDYAFGYRRTYMMGGIVEHNGEDCYLISVAYESVFADYLPYWDYGEVDSVAVLLPYKECSYDYSVSFNHSTTASFEVGIFLKVYVPVSLVEEVKRPPEEFLPPYATSVEVKFTIYRNKKTVGETIKIQAISDNPSNQLTLSFDKVNNRYPTYILIDGIRHEVDSVTETFKELSPSTFHDIEIRNWSSANANFVISGIKADLFANGEITHRELLGFDCEEFDRDNVSTISYGIISNKGNLSFMDTSGLYKALAENNLLTDNTEIEVFLHNTLAKSQQKIATMKADKWTYDNDNKSVSVSIKDDLEEWQDIQIEGFDYDVRNPSKVLPNKNMADLYKWLHERTPEKYKMLSFSALDSETKNILNSTTLPYPLLESGNLWSQWTKLCVVCGLHIYKNSQGKTVCVYKNGA